MRLFCYNQDSIKIMEATLNYVFEAPDPECRFLARGRGHVDFYLAQLLLAHECFCKYLHRFRLMDQAECDGCGVT